MKVILIRAMLLVVVSMTGCATTPFMYDRKNDAKDVFTATVGWGAGAKARIGPVNAGLFCNSDRAGLRIGQGFVKPRCMGEMAEITTPLPVFPGLHDGWYGLHSMEICEVPFPYEQRNKEFKGFGIIVPGVMTYMDAPASYYSQIEVAGGFIGTFRVGFNPGELLDFFLGWGGIDIYNDDLASNRQKAKPIGTPKAMGKPITGR
jgi:hypothetical protein